MATHSHCPVEVQGTNSSTHSLNSIKSLPFTLLFPHCPVTSFPLSCFSRDRLFSHPHRASRVYIIAFAVCACVLRPTYSAGRGVENCRWGFVWELLPQFSLSLCRPISAGLAIRVQYMMRCLFLLLSVLVQVHLSIEIGQTLIYIHS